MVGEARLEALDSGLAPVTDGWFVVNVRDAAWLENAAFGARCVFEGGKPVLRRRPDLAVHRFAELGLTLQVVWPGTREKHITYPRSELARRDRAGVEGETNSPAEAYAPFPHWQPERPHGWDGLPWA
jgi:hypothetical protein